MLKHRTNCKYFQYICTEIPKMFEYDLDKLKTPHCELGKMNTDNSCDNHCPWYEPDNKPIEQHNIPKS